MIIPFRRKVRRTPTILQMEAVECGAASLAMILAHYGRWVPLEELRLACGVSRDGSKASNILRAARRYGLAAKGFKKEPEQLSKLPLPSILHWNFNHFIVFEGIRRGAAHINDPGMGRRTMPLGELSDGFTGVVLAFEPTAEFRASGAPPRALPILWRMLSGSRDGLGLVVIISLALVFPAIVLPAFSKLFVDNVLVGGSRSWLGPLILGMAITAVLRAVILGLRQHYLLRLEVKLGLSMASRLVWHLLRLPINFFSQRHAGDVVTRITLTEGLATLLSGELATTMLHLVTVVFFVAAMAAYDLWLTAVVALVALLNLIALRVVSRRRDDVARRLAQDRAKLAASTVGVIRSVETIKASGIEQDAFARWAGFHAKAIDAAQDLGRQSIFIGVVPPLLATLGQTAILGLGGLRVMRGEMSVGDLVAFQTLAVSFSDPIARLVGMGARLQLAKADLTRVSDVFAYPTDPRTAFDSNDSDEGPGSCPMRLTGAIELRNVTFGYNPNEPPLLDNFNLIVRPGRRIALVGGSGSGKSTLARLICGLYPPWSGDILFDGRPIAQISPAVLANSLSYVDQDIFLFAGTVRENITLWDDSIDETRVARALQDVAMLEEIALRPGLYDYKIAEAGVDFSGGQRQRLEIARALVTEPSIIVLDEATAALDTLVEEEIDERLRRRGCTCVIIAHRYSTVRDADEIVVLAGGRVEGRGTHAELLDSCPHYAELLRVE